jgi:hypothetical protein
MDMTEIGRVYQYLLRYRSVESRPAQRRSRPDENVVASILRDASLEHFGRFNDFLAPQGFKLVEFDDATRGVSAAGRVWVLARTGETPASTFLSTERVFAEMDIKGNGTHEESAIWFLHIWLIYLSLIYTRAGRGVSEVSGYIDGTFSREALELAVNEHSEHIRQLGISDETTSGASSRVVAILDAEKGKDVPRRITAFLKLMIASGLVQEIDKNEYQQTLLGAYEIAEHYDKSLRIPIDNTLDNLVNIVAPDSEHDTTKEQTHGAD